MLLETALTIYMTGLMSHIGQDPNGNDSDPKVGLAIVAAKHHSASVRIASQFVSGNPPQTYSHDLKEGQRITFSGGGLGPGPALADDQFRNFVPSLKEPFTNMLIHDDTKKLAKHDDVIYMHYPTGTLSIACFHRQEAKFSRKGTEVETQCVPKVTKFVSEATTGDITMTITNADGSVVDQKVLTPEATVWLLNDSHETDKAKVRRHFMLYSKILKRKSPISTRQLAAVDPGGPCHETPDWTACPKPPGIEITISDDPACTNTDWP